MSGSGYVDVCNYLVILILLLLFHRVPIYVRAIDINIFEFDIFKPFHYTVHITYLITVLIIISVLQIFSKWECKEFQDLSLFLLSIGALFQQGANYKISLISTRCFILFIFLVGILTFTFYTSNLVSRLVNLKYESDINSMDDLMNSDISIGFLDALTTRNFVKVSIEQIPKKTY